MSQVETMNSLLINSNLLFTSACSTQNQSELSSPMSPNPPDSPPSSSLPTTLTIIPSQQTYGSVNVSKLIEEPTIEEQQPHQLQQTNTTINLISNKSNIRKVIRTLAGTAPTSSSPSPSPVPTTSPSIQQHVVVQTVNKKSNTSPRTSPTSAILNSNTRQVNVVTITPVNYNGNSISSSTTNQINTITTTVASTSTIAASSSSNPSQINIPLNSLQIQPIQQQIASAGNNPPTTIINKITKCSQSVTLTPSSSSSLSSNINTLTPKLVLNGTSNTLTNGNTSLVDVHPIAPKLNNLTQQRASFQQPTAQIIKTVTTTTATITNSTSSPSTTTTSNSKFLFSTIPIQNSVSTIPTSTTNLVSPRIIIATSATNGTVATVSNTPSNFNVNNSTTTVSASPTTIKNYSSKLTDTLNKPIIIDAKRNASVTSYLKPNASPSTSHRTTVNAHLLEAKKYAKAAEAGLMSVINANIPTNIPISQFLSQLPQRFNFANVVTLSSQQPQPPASTPATTVASTNTTQTTTNLSPTTPTTPTTSISFNISVVTTATTTTIPSITSSPVQATLSSPIKPNIIRKTKTKVDCIEHGTIETTTSDLPQQTIINLTVVDNNQTSSPPKDSENTGIDLRQIFFHTPNKNDIIRLKPTSTLVPQIATNLSATPKNQSKMILNLSKLNTTNESTNITPNDITSSPTISTSTIKVQQISTIPIQLQQSPAGDLLTPSTPMQQTAILHIPYNLTTSPNTEPTSLLGTFISNESPTSIQLSTPSTEPQASDTQTTTKTVPKIPEIPSEPCSSSNSENSNTKTTTISRRKRRIHEYKDSDSKPNKSQTIHKTSNCENHKNEIQNENLEECQPQPPKKQTRAIHSTSKYKSKKSAKGAPINTTLKSVDNNLEKNSDLNVNKHPKNELDNETIKKLSPDFVYVDKNGIQWRARCSIMEYYRPTWIARNNHFLRYSDLKIIDEPKKLDDLLLDRERLKDLDEWSFHCVVSQFKELINYENDSLNFINEIESLLKSKVNCNDKKVYEAVKANAQRHLYISEQLNEAHVLIQNLVKHKQTFIEILNRNPSTNITSTSSSTSTSTKTPKNSLKKPKIENKTPKNLTKKSLIKTNARKNSKTSIKSKHKKKE